MYICICFYSKLFQNCDNLENLLDDCSKFTIEECRQRSKGCEKHCCELTEDIAEPSQTCANEVDMWGHKTCSVVKESGSCYEHAEHCALTCCEEKSGHVNPHKQKPCSHLEDEKSAKYCYDKAFSEHQCSEIAHEKECPLACCIEYHLSNKVQNSRKRRDIFSSTLPTISSSSTTSGFTDDIPSTSHSTSTTESSTTSYDSFCFDQGFENKNGDDFCRDRLQEDEEKCEKDSFRAKCELACCLVDPTPCLEYSDKLSEAVCYQRVLLGRCSEPGTAKKCQRSCCEAGELETTSKTTSVTTQTQTDEKTTETTTYQLCSEYTDVSANCEKRVEKGRCKEPLSEEVKCQYSCCMDLFETTTAEPTTPTTVKTTTVTESVSSEGIIECLCHEDEASPDFCVAVMNENLCNVWEFQHLCEFSCCMFNFAHDTEDTEEPEVDICESCDDEVDILPYETCLVETFVMGYCEETSDCDKTCCLWDGTFYGNPCLRFLDEAGYQYCTINCFDQCDDDNLCEILCQRTVCLFCNKPDFWPSSTDAPSECYGLTNEDSGVDCALKAGQGDCTPGDGFYDELCDFSCCVVDVHQKRTARKVLTFHDNQKTMQIVPEAISTGNQSEQKKDCLDASSQDDPECIETTVAGSLVRKKRSELFIDGEMQIEPSYIFIGLILLLTKLCL